MLLVVNVLVLQVKVDIGHIKPNLKGAIDTDSGHLGALYNRHQKNTHMSKGNMTAGYCGKTAKQVYSSDNSVISQVFTDKHLPASTSVHTHTQKQFCCSLHFLRIKIIISTLEAESLTENDGL